MTKRVLILNDDGTATVNGVKVRVVPVEYIKDALYSLGAFCSNEDWTQEDMDNMDRLYGFTLDLSGLPRAEGDWSALFDERAK